jgi:dihydroorotate dehydrogenase electron transfer subunit
VKRPVAAEITEIDNRTSVGHSLWLAPRVGWEAQPVPGQFVMVALRQPPAGFGREVCDAVPMSVAGWEPGRLRLTVKDLGPTTKALLACRPGDSLAVTGPLGHGFSLDARHPLLMGGGVGAPPLLFLAQAFAASGVEPLTLLGGATAAEIFHRDEFPGRVEIATDDGSAGHRGFVTDLLEGRSPDMLYSCGPEPMLVKALEWALASGIPAELCLERYMACGVGLCGVCTIDRDLVCQDGPVLSGEQLADSVEFGKVVHEAGGVVRRL